MLRKILVVIILLSVFKGYSQKTTGKVYADNKPMEGVLIINTTQNRHIITVVYVNKYSDANTC